MQRKAACKNIRKSNHMGRDSQNVTIYSRGSSLFYRYFCNLDTYGFGSSHSALQYVEVNTQYK